MDLKYDEFFSVSHVYGIGLHDFTHFTEVESEKHFTGYYLWTRKLALLISNRVGREGRSEEMLTSLNNLFPIV